MQISTLVPNPVLRHDRGVGSASRSADVPAETARICALFLARTAAVGPPGDDDRAALAASVLDVLRIDNNQVIPLRPQPSGDLRLVIDGWAYRAHILPNGTRQITDILLPGDLVEVATTADEVAHNLRASGNVRLAALRGDLFADREASSLRLRLAWMREERARVLRSRLVSLGRHGAAERVACLMLELHRRLDQVGLVADGRFTCSFTQEQIADALGLTAVHVNRTLGRLRRQGLLIVDRPHIGIPSLCRLRAAQHERT